MGKRKGKSHDEVVDEGVEGLKSGRWKTAQEAADALGVPGKKNTIWRRFTERAQSRSEAHRPQMILSAAQEEVLIAWCKYLGFINMPLNKKTLRPKVELIANRRPSVKWCTKWLRRNKSQLAGGRGRGLDPKRAQCFNFSTVNQHFELFREKVERRGIPLRNVWNLDEIGMQLGGGRRNTREVYIFAAEDSSRYRQISDDLQLITVLECVCADGTAKVMPCFVFPGTWFDGQWAEDAKKWSHVEVLFATTETGWTSNEICRQWFERIFIPQAKSLGDPNFPIILMLDGHGSHLTADMSRLGIENEVDIYQLPPHTTHRLQPCDVGAFGPLKHFWTKYSQDYLAENGEGLPLRAIVDNYFRAREDGFKANTILSAWRRSGIDVDSPSGVPKANPGVFTAADFAPSVASSSSAHLPASFPLPPNWKANSGPTAPVDSSSADVGFADDPDQPNDDADSDGTDSDGADSDNAESAMEISQPPMSTSGPSRMPFTAPAAAPSGPSSLMLPPPPTSFSTPAPKAPTVDTPMVPVILTNLDDPAEITDDFTDKSSMSDSTSEMDEDDLRASLRKERLDKRRLRKKYRNEKREKEKAVAHCGMAATRIDELQHTLNAKRSKGKGASRNLVVQPNEAGARVTTTTSLLKQQETAEAATKAKQQRQADKQHGKALEKEEVTRVRGEMSQPGYKFTGSLASHKAAQSLRNIAWSLGIPDADTLPNVKAVRQAIDTWVETFPQRKDEPKFAALFRTTRGGKRKQKPASDTPSRSPSPCGPSSPSRRRLNGPSPPPSTPSRRLRPSTPLSHTSRAASGSRTSYFPVPPPPFDVHNSP